MKETELSAIKEHFQDRPVLSKSDLIDFIVRSFPGKDKRYGRFYLADILKEGVAYPIRTGLWKKADGKKPFSAVPDVDTRLINTLARVLPPCVISVWNTSSLNHLLSFQSFHDFSIVSSNGFSQEDVFSCLSNASYFPISLKNYLAFKEKPTSKQLILVSSMNEDAPLFRGRKKYHPDLGKSLIVFPRIEKILVDCFCGDVALDPAQIREVFSNAFLSYFVNFSVLERYARSRGKKEEVISLLNELSLWDGCYD